MTLPFTTVFFTNPDTGESYGETVQRANDTDIIMGGGLKYPWESPSAYGYTSYEETGAPLGVKNSAGFFGGNDLIDWKAVKNWLLIGGIILLSYVAYNEVRRK